MPSRRASSAAATEHGDAASGADGINIIFVNIDWKASRHHNPKSSARNLGLLGNTVLSIVQEMAPAVICFCEVGNVMSPLNADHIRAIEATVHTAWANARVRDTATEHVVPDIRFLHTKQEPYLVAWDATAVDCKHQRILRNLYVHADGEPRTAQGFVCTKPGQPDSTGIDVINVHAPSGGRKLTDSQRTTLLKNLLQGNSQCDSKRNLAEASFLIGGDMNTGELVLAQILMKLKSSGVQQGTSAMRPVWGHHGDILLQRQIPCCILNTRAVNHDPKHVPYGIRWQLGARLPTEQPSSSSNLAIPARWPCRAEGLDTRRDVPTLHVSDLQEAWPATEQPAPATKPPASPPTPATKQPSSSSNMFIPGRWHRRAESTDTRRPAPTPQVSELQGAWPAPEQPASSPTPCPPHVRFASPATEQPAPSQTAAAEEPSPEPVEAATAKEPATEQPVSSPTPAPKQRASPPTPAPEQPASSPTPRPHHVRSALPATEQPASSQSAAAVEPAPEPVEAATAKGPATVQPDNNDEANQSDSDYEHAELQDARPDKDLAYAIVNAFLGSPSLLNSDVEEAIRDIINDETQWSPEMFDIVDRVFRPVFFYYPNGLNDRSLWIARDPALYISHLREYTSLRERVDVGANVPQLATEQLMHFDERQVQAVFQAYLAQFNRAEATAEQLSRGCTYLKSCAEAKLNRECGGRLIVFAIWEVGLPQVRAPSLATEQRDASARTLPTEQLQQIERDTNKILHWLDLMANGVEAHKSTEQYARAARKAGSRHKESGLNATELEHKWQLQHAKNDLRIAKHLDRKWNRREVTYSSINQTHWRLLQEYWSGDLEARKETLLRNRGPTEQSRLPITGQR